MTIYADYNGSAPVCREVQEFFKKRLDSQLYANPNAHHNLGQKILMNMENARSVCAQVLGASPKQVIFNSGASEGISQAFFSILHGAGKKERSVIIISGIEHPAVSSCARFYEKDQGFSLKILPTLSSGLIDLVTLHQWLQSEEKKHIALVAIMAANNETGIIQPYEQISQLCRQAQVPYLCDTTQLMGKKAFHFQESGVDYAFLSGHKIGALTGTGLLLARNPELLQPLIWGGGQENKLRGGTQNYLGNETLAIALKKFQNQMDKLEALQKKREQFEASLKKQWPNLVIFGQDAPRLSNTTFLSLPGTNAQIIQIKLAQQDIYVTTSSACSDEKTSSSKILKSMNVGNEVARGAIRISFSSSSPLEGYDQLERVLHKVFQQTQESSSLAL